MDSINDMIESLDMETNNLVIKYDKLISKLNNEINNLFFSNLKEEDVKGPVEEPIVFNKNTEYGQLEEEKREVKVNIERINQELNNPDVHFNGVNGQGEMEERKKDLSFYSDRLKLIDEQPKYYLRYTELCRGDFSKVEDETVKDDLVKKYNLLVNLRKKRNAIIGSLSNNSLVEEQGPKKK